MQDRLLLVYVGWKCATEHLLQNKTSSASSQSSSWRRVGEGKGETKEDPLVPHTYPAMTTISKRRPERAEQPGPPVIQRMRGSSAGLRSDWMK